MDLRFTLLSDGPSDKALMPILEWLLKDIGVTVPIQSEWADLSRLPRPPKLLPEKIRVAIELYPCDLLFVHRDAENEARITRVEEINKLQASQQFQQPVVCVIPIRMQEAWLLIDEGAIRRAAGNPNGKVPLALPKLRELEVLPDPKDVLYGLLEQASELRGRRLRAFRPSQKAYQVSLHLRNFSLLLQLSAFQALEQEVRTSIRKNLPTRNGSPATPSTRP